MAIFYSRLSLVTRSQGHSAVAAAAYRAGSRLYDDRTRTSHDFSKKRGVLNAGMLAPRDATWALDIGTSWNRAESSEVRKNARTARELIVALPVELPPLDQVALARRIGQDLVDRYTVAVLVAVHAPDAKSDDRNVHVHLLMSTRVANADGYGAKVRVLDDQKSGPKEAEAMRTRVAERINEALARHGSVERVDPRRLREQATAAAASGDLDGVVIFTRAPTRHEGREATAAARRGEASMRGASNAAIRRDNADVQTAAAVRVAAYRQIINRRKARLEQALLDPSRAEKPRVPFRPFQPRPSRGTGVVGKSARAVGADAGLLNSQAQLSEASARLARDCGEAYVDALAQEVAAQEAALRGYLKAAYTAAPELLRVKPSTRSAVVAGIFQEASSTFSACNEAALAHEQSRRRTAEAEVSTARVRSVGAQLDEKKPPAWHVRSRRQWAELRRDQRAAEAEAERTERRERGSQQRRSAASREAHAVWRDAHSKLVASLTSAAELSREAKRATPRMRADARQATDRKNRPPDASAASSHRDEIVPSPRKLEPSRAIPKRRSPG